MPATEPTPDLWNDSLLQNPHEVSDKRSRVQKMFAAIAPSYDLNNRLHSLWMDQRWRRRAVKLANLQKSDSIVDVACGTGDLTKAFTIELVELIDWPARQGQVIGIDFTFEMLPIARHKWLSDGIVCEHETWMGPDGKPMGINPGAAGIIQYLNGDALCLPLADKTANVLSIAFGIRNVSDPSAALKEFHRVLKPGGRLIILEFSLPTNRILRSLYNFYFTKILPRTATWISRDKTGAYKYLPQSVNTFISRDSMQEMMRDAGFTNVQAFPLTFGICVLLSRP